MNGTENLAKMVRQIIESSPYLHTYTSIIGRLPKLYSRSVVEQVLRELISANIIRLKLLPNSNNVGFELIEVMKYDRKLDILVQDRIDSLSQLIAPYLDDLEQERLANHLAVIVSIANEICHVKE